jgi:ABC-type nickel/cobalt efflux system permease component RcnA
LETQLLVALSAAFVLGVEHAFEPDHVVAVSTIATQSRRVSRSLLTGWLWGLGHTVTLLVAGTLVLLLRVQFPMSISNSFELVVGVMLIVLGVWTIHRLRKSRFHFHAHTHHGETHAHVHSHAEGVSHDHAHVPFSVGIVHGLAGSGTLVVLTMSTMANPIDGVFFIASFGIGLILAMSLIASAISAPSILGGRFSSLIKPVFSAGAGILSITLGIFIISGFFA